MLRGHRVAHRRVGLLDQGAEVRDDGAGGGGSASASSAGGGSAGSAGEGGSASSAGGGSASSGGAGCEPGRQEACYGGPPDALNRGACRAGVKICDDEGNGYGPCAGEVLPAAERCDTAEDEDCDGAVNAGWPTPGAPTSPRRAERRGFARSGRGRGRSGVPRGVRSGDGRRRVGARLQQRRFGGGNDAVVLGHPVRRAARDQGRAGARAELLQGLLYLVGREYRDEIADIKGTVAEVMRATAEGIDTTTMKLLRPLHVSGDADVFFSHFLSGWSSGDHDGDTAPNNNCAVEALNVTQHYAQCWEYNLGADGDAPFDDGGWGPHLGTHIADQARLANDNTRYTRVRRILAGHGGEPGPQAYPPRVPSRIS